MARTRQWRRGFSHMLWRNKYEKKQQDAGFSTCQQQDQSRGWPAPSDRSPLLLLSLPFEILATIFRMVLQESISHSLLIAPFYRFFDLETALAVTESLRGVCSIWSQVTRSLYLASAVSRDGILYRVRTRHLPRLRAVFPSLEDCMLDLGDPGELPGLEQTRLLLKSLASEQNDLGFISAVVLEEDPEKFLRDAYPRELLKALYDEVCSTHDLSLPGYYKHLDDDELSADDDSGPPDPGSEPQLDERIIEFLEVELVALNYYHAHIFRQILSLLPRLSYLEVPAFMLPPLLLESCGKPDEASQKPLEFFNIKYEECGEPLMSIMNSAPFLQVTAFPNPIYSLFSYAERSRAGYNPVYDYWELTIERSLEQRMRARFQQACDDLGDAKDGFENMRGLAYRGKELTCIDSDDDMSRCLGHFRSTQLEQFHFLCALPLTSERTLDLSLVTGYNTLTSLTIDLRPSYSGRSRYHFCAVLASDDETAFPHLQDLDVSLGSACPTLMKALAKRPVVQGSCGKWNIRTMPRICRQWSPVHGVGGEAYEPAPMTFADLEKILETARSCGSDRFLDSNLSLTVQDVGDSRMVANRWPLSRTNPILHNFEINFYRGPHPDSEADCQADSEREDDVLRLRYTYRLRRVYRASTYLEQRDEEGYLLTHSYTERTHELLHRAIRMERDNPSIGFTAVLERVVSLILLRMKGPGDMDQSVHERE